MVSNFLITINTNYRPYEDSENYQEVSRRLANFVDGLFTGGDPERVKSVLRFLPPYASDANSPFWTYIERARVLASGIEVGNDPRGQRVHAHIQWQVTHRTKIHIDRVALRDMAQAAINHPLVKGMFVHVRAEGDPQNAIDYVNKNQVAAAGPSKP